VNIIACPSCARQGFAVIDTVKILEEKLSHIKEPINLSVIGCVVNGPGEASQTHIGITGGGKGEHMMYLSGLPHHKVASDKIIEEVISLVEKKSKELKSN
jgi:(E)-4-hydroxy-3-methylbut-2-enyl-diphosphate synthase